MKGIIHGIRFLPFFLIFLAGFAAASCHNSSLYSFSGTGVNDHTMVRFNESDVLDDLVKANLSNVVVSSGQDYWYYDDFELLIDTTSGLEDFTVVIHDSTFNTGLSSSAILPDVVVELNRSNLDLVASSYFMDFKLEPSGVALNFSMYGNLSLEVLCDSYSPFSIDLDSYGLTSFNLGVWEPAQLRVRFDIEVNESYIREQFMTETLKSFDFYLPHTDSGELVFIDYTLQDYTGDYGESVLHLKRSISGDVFEDMDSRQWDSEGKIKAVWLYPDEYYRIVLTTSDATVDKGLFQYTSNGSQDVRVTEPVVSYPDSALAGSVVRVWRNVSTQRVYCYYSVNDSLFQYANFSVSNASVVPNTLLYQVGNVTSSTGSFSYLVPDVNLTYKVDCRVFLDGSEPDFKVRVFGMRNESDRFMDPGFDYDIMGFSVAECFGLFSIFLVLFILGFASQVNASIIGVLGVGALWLFDAWNWNIVNAVLLSFLLVLVALWRLKQSREGVG